MSDKPPFKIEEMTDALGLLNFIYKELEAKYKGLEAKTSDLVVAWDKERESFKGLCSAVNALRKDQEIMSDKPPSQAYQELRAAAIAVVQRFHAWEKSPDIYADFFESIRTLSHKLNSLPKEVTDASTN